MVAWWLRARALDGRELLIAALASTTTALIALAGIHKLGTAGLLAPLALGLVLILLSNSLAMTVFVVGLTVMCEGAAFGLFTFTVSLYTHATVLNVLVALVVLAVGLDLLRRKQPLWLPATLALPLVMLGLAMVDGVVTGRAAGVGLTKALHSENLLAYLLFLPIAVANLNIDRHQVSLLLKGAFAVAIVKAMLGLLEVASGHGATIEGGGSLTYYEPLSNWLIMIAVLGIFAAVVARMRPPLWMLLGSPLLVASLLLSYRRSFWVAAVLGLLLVLLLALSPTGRRLLVPTGLLVAGAIWLLGSVNFQAQSPLLRRAVSLTPSSLTTNLEDRYRLDERANVLGAIGEHPITGLGMQVPWTAGFRGLSVEHLDGRQYVHFAALWYWLKLGILGLVAYITLLIGAAVLAWRVWSRGRQPSARAFGLASLCGLAGLVVIETTASFTGVDARFTVLFGAQVGLLGLLARQAESSGD
jgi:O-Antigen ligase